MIKDEIINIIEPLALATTDKSLIAPLVNYMPLYMRITAGQISSLHTPAHLQASFDFAIGPNPTKNMILLLDLSVLHFTSLPNPQNFADMSKDPFPSPKAPAPKAPTAPAGDTLAPPAGTVPVTNIFNYAALPSDVRLRFYHHADSIMMTRSAMDIEFDSTIPNLTLDPTGNTMRTTLSYLDPSVTGDRN